MTVADVVLPACLLACCCLSVTRAMGTRMAKITPSRGFAAELATALVILVSAQWGLPNSSSQVPPTDLPTTTSRTHKGACPFPRTKRPG